MFSVTIAGEGDDAVAQVSAVLRGRRFRVETLPERRASARHRPSDGLVVVTGSSDRMRVTKVVLDARRDDDVRFLPFALVARAVERSTASAFGAKTVVRIDGPPEELAAEVRRMLLREQESAALVHQLEGELGDLRIGDVLDTLARGGRDAVVRVAAASSRGALRVRRGHIVTATFDALAGRDALTAILALRTGRFRVELRTVDDTDELGALDVETARAVLEAVDRKPPPATPAAPPTDERAPLAALAAAIINAVGAHARRFLPDTVVARELEAAQRAATREAPLLTGFRVTSNALTLVVRVDTIDASAGRGLGLWVGGALDRLEALRPGRFGRARAHEVLGGLTRLMEQVGFRADFDAALGASR